MTNLHIVVPVPTSCGRVKKKKEEQKYMITTDTRYQLNAQTKQTSLQRNKDEGEKWLQTTLQKDIC